MNDQAFYANVARDTDLVLKPVPNGGELSLVLRSPASPADVRLDFGLPAGASLRVVDDTATHAPVGSVEVVKGAKRIALIPPAVAVDALGKSLPVSYSVRGSRRLVMHVQNTAGAAWPVIVDPTVGIGEIYGQGNGTQAEGWPRWGYYQPVGSAIYGYIQGGAIYASAPAGYWYSGQYGEWIRSALPNSFIYFYQAYNSTTVPPGSNPYLSHDFAGVYSSAANNWETGSWTSPTANTGASGYVLRYNSGPVGGDITNYYVHSSNTIATDIADNNSAAFGLQFTATGSFGSAFAGMGNAVIYSSEYHPPTLNPPSHTQPVPAGWVSSYTDTPSFHAQDTGLGMGTIKTTYADGSAASAGNNCTAQYSSPCSLAQDATAPAYGDGTSRPLPEGIDTLSASATDIVGNHNAGQDKNWQVKIDRTPPSAGASGPLYDDRNLPGHDGGSDLGNVSSDETVAVAVDDGASATPRSGVASIEMQVDGRRIRPEDLATQTCASGQCPYHADSTFTFHPTEVGPGDKGTHAVAIIARDALADPSSTVAGPHVSVQNFSVYVPDQPSDAATPPTGYQQAPPDTTPSPDAPPGDSDPQPVVTDLTPAQNAQARGVVASDAATPASDLATVLGGSGYTMTNIGPLTTGVEDPKGKLPTVGALVEVTLATPHAVDAVVTSYRPPWPGTTATVPFKAHLVASAVRDLLVDVDFGSNRIISVEPGFDSNEESFDPVPGQGALPPVPPPED